jgi:hypothetical protein
MHSPNGFPPTGEMQTQGLIVTSFGGRNVIKNRPDKEEK